MQTVMLIYKLFGGSVNSGVPGDPTNMFGYTGPRGVKVSPAAQTDAGHVFCAHGTLKGAFMSDEACPLRVQQ